jgi:hypothetical protein
MTILSGLDLLFSSSSLVDLDGPKLKFGSMVRWTLLVNSAGTKFVDGPSISPTSSFRSEF